MHTHAEPVADLTALDAMVAKAANESLAFPVLVIPPGTLRDFEGTTSPDWTLKNPMPRIDRWSPQ